MKRFLLTILALLLLPASAGAQDFEYMPPGTLVAGSGTGRVDETVYVPDMRYPIEVAPSYPNSQVWGRGGSQGPGGGQCDEQNYSYPWWDNYCESRRWDMPLCPSGNGHQGQDIRPSTCDKSTHWTVAAEAGRISNIGSYSVYLISNNGTQHRYLHLDMGRLAVSEGQTVAKGDRIGLVSNDFGGTPTTIHLHYDLNQNIPSAGGNVYVPTYMSLVRSYETLLGVEQEPCKIIPAEGDTLDDYGPCATFFGPAQFWREVDGMGHGGKMHWTNGWENATPSNWARWSLHFAEPGIYNVEFNVVPPYNVSKKARYMVRANGEESTQEVDQSAVEDWFSLGEFQFAEGGDQRVELYDNTGETADDQHITADAIRVTRVDLPEADMGGTTDPPDMGGNNDNNNTNGNNNTGNNTSGNNNTGGDVGLGGFNGFSPENVRVNKGCCAVVDHRANSVPLWLAAAFLLVGGAVRRRGR